MEKRVLDLEFRLMRTERPLPSEVSQRDGAYKLWRRNWVQTFDELGVQRKLTSDDFLHRELGGLFLGEQPIGFMLYHFINLEDEVWRETSYFNNYPDEIKLLHTDRPERVMVISYMTLESEWRKSETDLPISELLTSFAVMRFLSSDAKRLIGYFRNSRKTNEMFYRHGGMPLVRASRAYNVDVDFAEILKRNATLSSLPGCAEAALELWDKHHHATRIGEGYGNTIGTTDGRTNGHTDSSGDTVTENSDGPSRREASILRLG